MNQLSKVWVDAILDNLRTHRAMDVLLWSLTHPRWKLVFQPTSATYLNLIAPWWKTLPTLALRGRRFATWDELWIAIEHATEYWDAHRHPLVLGSANAAARHAWPGLVPSRRSSELAGRTT